MVDNFSNGHIATIECVGNISDCALGFSNTDIRDGETLDRIFTEFNLKQLYILQSLKL